MHSHSKKPLMFVLITVMLYGMGFGITAPVTPFLVKLYVQSEGQQAFAIALLTLVYALGVFVSAPALGALSDRFGRRPILMFCMLGSALGYLVFGIGGALWVLLLGRIIDGLTGGNISVMLAYLSDISSPEERVKYFGYAGAASGVGVLLGPSLGGLLAGFGMTVPIYFGAAITLLNLLYGYFAMPETVSAENRSQPINLSRLNPFSLLFGIFKLPKLRWVFIAIALIGLPSGALQSFFAQFGKDVFHWQPLQIGLLFSLLGVMDIAAQSLLMPRLSRRLKTKQIAMLGSGLEAVGYALMALSGLLGRFEGFLLGVIAFGLGDAILGPAMGGLASEQVGEAEQGSIQGSSQALQAMTRVAGPILGGLLYVNAGHVSPMILGSVLLLATLWTLKNRGARSRLG